MPLNANNEGVIFVFHRLGYTIGLAGNNSQALPRLGNGLAVEGIHPTGIALKNAHQSAVGLHFLALPGWSPEFCKHEMFMSGIS